jgi:hypothetical protein
MAFAMAVYLIGNVDGPASGFCDGYLALARRLEVPYQMVVFWMCEQLIRGHGPLL